MTTPVSEINEILTDTLIYENFCFEISAEVLDEEFRKFCAFADSMMSANSVGKKRFTPFYSMDFTQRNNSSQDSFFVEFYASLDYSLDFDHPKLSEIDIGRYAVSGIRIYDGKIEKLVAPAERKGSEPYSILNKTCMGNLFRYYSGNTGSTILLDAGIYRGIIFSDNWTKVRELYTVVPPVDRLGN